MLKRTQLAELPPRLGASPGLLRRRYSVPETIMRKYRLAQQRSDSDSGPATVPSPASMSPPQGSCGSLCETPHRFIKRDRELMRKSALLRRMWGRSSNTCQTCCCNGDLIESHNCNDRETRSLDGSRCELRHLSSSLTSSRHSNNGIGTGWATPKRQRLESRQDFRGSDEMLRAAMRNSFDKNEQHRHERTVKADSSLSAQGQEAPLFVELSSGMFTDANISVSDDTNKSTHTLYPSPDTTFSLTLNHSETMTDGQKFNIQIDSSSFTDTSDTFSHTVPTTKENDQSLETIAKDRLSEPCEISKNIDRNVKNNIQLYSNPVIFDASPYEVLEIIVSESIDTTSLPSITNDCCDKQALSRVTKHCLTNNKTNQNVDIDKYVSNILVQSLNSLTDQIDNMNASMGKNGKLNIVEKEIKVKLQNTGVNTIVHLSPTSNNQIIFGNKELCNSEYKDSCNNLKDTHDKVAILDEIQSYESNNNLTSAETLHKSSKISCEAENENKSFNSLTQNENVNKIVLQQIQKLFQDGISGDSKINYNSSTIPGISRIEISNVDVFIADNGDSISEKPITKKLYTHKNSENSNVISGVGSGNYFRDVDNNLVVPRFSAFPHSDSMEVNTSSSDDPEVVGSDCTSLVDSLDDPNSPRSMFLRRSVNANKRSELVRSAIDILDLLPENTSQVNNSTPKEKGESFFIRIKDDECDCEKENIVVADHMPEKIKQRLYRRHRKREMRMECARRTRAKQMKKKIEKQKYKDICRTKKEIEKECLGVINSLIDDVIKKIAHDEYKCMRIKHKTNKIFDKPEDNLLKRNTNNCDETFSDSSKRNTKNSDVKFLNHKDSFSLLKNEPTSKEKRTKNGRRVHGKLSLQPHLPITPDDYGPKRVYQKSEIHEGDKRIEILEILEYVDTSQSSPDTNSEESCTHYTKNKKSRIPIPIYERIQTISHINSKKNNVNTQYDRASSVYNREDNGRSSRLIASMFLDSLSDDSDSFQKVRKFETNGLQTRRVSVPCESRSRSNSLRFKRIFDIIPEEKSSLSVESSNEDMNYHRRVSAPNISTGYCDNHNRRHVDINDSAGKGILRNKTSSNKNKQTKSASTSPLMCQESNKSVPKLNVTNKTTMTSPLRKSAATSPICSSSSDGAKRGLTSRPRAWLGFYRSEKQLHEEEGIAFACAPCH